jgi:NADPH-dependent glutamate synthase beta subunit-like oxidoreductase
VQPCAFDEPVAVHLVERDLGDRIWPAAPVLPRTIASRADCGHRLGTGGLALRLSSRTARIRRDVFEEAAEAGGMLRQGIPAYRLPRNVLDRQIEWFRDCGIEIRCDTRIEATPARTAGGLCDAVFLPRARTAVGRWASPGEDGSGVRARAGVPEGGQPRRAAGRRAARVIVVGGGNTAMDCARTALRLGADADGGLPPDAAGDAGHPGRDRGGSHEGVAFEFLAESARVPSRKRPVVGVECDRMVLGEPDASGRRRPVALGDGAFSMPVDTC